MVVSRLSRLTLAGSVPAVAVPMLLTVLLTGLQRGQSRDYVFLYLGIVAVLGITVGLVPALVGAAVSFLCLDYFFVAPVHTLSIADETDLVNLLVFFGSAGVIGGLGSRRRRTQLEAEALARQLRTANSELARLNQEQAETARTAVRLARSEQHVRLLEESDRLRRELLQNVSHELRTPLGSILMDATSARLRAATSEEGWGDLEAIADQARRLDRLVGDLLDLARIEGGALDLRLECVDLVEAVEAAADRLRRHHPVRAVDLVVDGEIPEIVADWGRLGQVLDNLLNNANRFAPADSPITVRVVPGLRGMVVTHVVDRGGGVSAELRPHIFERFVGDAGRGADSRSTGLGLAIVKGLVEAHAGRVWLEESTPGEGAHLAFALPAAVDAL